MDPLETVVYTRTLRAWRLVAVLFGVFIIPLPLAIPMWFYAPKAAVRAVQRRRAVVATGEAALRA